MPLGEFSSNPPPVWTFGHFRCIHEKIDGGHFGENSSMGPRIGDGDTELWRGKRIRNSPGKHHGTRNLPDPRGYLGTPPVSPPSAAPGTPWIRAVRPLPGISHAPLWDWCQTASKTDPQSASNFDPLELSVMASPRGRGGSLLASVFEPPAVVAGLDDLAMMGDSVQERRGHLGVAKDLAPLAKGQVGRHQDRSPFVEL